jgi:isocitrate dehydrogenase
VPSLEKIAEQTGNATAAILAATLDKAVGSYLEGSCAPSRKVNEIDNRGSSFQLARFWAAELAAQEEDAELAARFAPVAQALHEKQEVILAELLAAQGEAVDLGGYFHPDLEKCAAALRPSATFNGIVDGIACAPAS